jgi:hypothetical protein
MGFVHRNLFTPVPEAEDWEGLNRLLAERCRYYAATHRVPGTSISVAEAWASEKKHLLPLPPHAFPCCRYVQTRAAQNQLVRFENNYYSVPSNCVGRPLLLKAFVHQVEIYADRLCVATHPRSYAKGQEVYDLDHYLDTLYQKPGALEDAKPFRRAGLPEVYPRYLADLKDHHPHPEREFVQILLLHREVGWESLTQALEEAHTQRIYHAAGVRQILLRLTGKCLAPAQPAPGLSAYKVDRPPLSRFGLLLGGTGRVWH